MRHHRNIEIAFEDYGAGAPILLVHGFASNGKVNWLDTGWVETLVDAGFRAITIDNRGHGQSQKLYDPALYPARMMARDVVNLIDHLDLGTATLLGYSMGARISAFATMGWPDKVGAVVFGGLGINMIRGLSDTKNIIDGLEAPSLSDVTHASGRQFRIFAEHTGSDLKALAACMASSRDRIGEADISKIPVPALVAVGDKDEVGGPAAPLAALMRKGEAFVIKGRDHMRATGDPQFKAGVLSFLQRNNIA